jgi:6-pyruvoyltetrahydropterin/6-carboxytetrahydropterin synthase
VIVLPLDNITAERLAEYICKGIIERLQPKAANLADITVGVEEAPGQTAYYRQALTD